MHDDLGRKNRTTRFAGFLPRQSGFTSDFLSFIVVEHNRFFHGALQLLEIGILWPYLLSALSIEFNTVVPFSDPVLRTSV